VGHGTNDSGENLISQPNTSLSAALPPCLPQGEKEDGRRKREETNFWENFVFVRINAMGSGIGFEKFP
jgi:hypothetical protein